MRGQQQHRNRASIWKGDAEGRGRPLELPSNPDCAGQVKRLYTRRTNPQRWIVVGVYCTGCHAVTFGPEPPD